MKMDLVQGERNTYGLMVDKQIVTNAPKGGIIRHIRSFEVDEDKILNKIKKGKNDGD